ncbi:uncharacterized protein LOC111129774 isoform X2 [Crassostrea virginica]
MHAFQSLFLFVFASFISESSTEKRFLLLPFLDIPVHYDHWSSWGECLGPCGGTGTRQRIRGCHEIQLGIIHFSAKCPISGEQKETCNGICQQTTVAKTTTTLGVWGNWGKFSSCDKTCGGGSQIRHRVCGGGNCAGDSLESVSCNSHPCPGSWSHWGQFSSCDKSCGGGIQIRRRVCGGGTCRGDSLESSSCNTHQCPVKSSTLFPTTRTSASTPPPPTTTTTTTLKPTTTNRALYITIKRREENKQ